MLELVLRLEVKNKSTNQNFNSTLLAEGSDDFNSGHELPEDITVGNIYSKK